MLTLGAAGAEPIDMVVDPGCEAQPFTITLTAYTPALLAVTAVTTGFCEVEVKLLGPVQLYEALLTAAVLNCKS